MAAKRKAAPKKPVRTERSLLKKAAVGSAKLALKPHMLMASVLVGLVACSSNQSSRNTSDGYSPYGGTSEPTAVKVGKPYTIKGETYVPRHEPEYVQTGVASWYGPNFHGRMTASGEEYDQHEMTAAHKTLPMPSLVRVTRLDSGESVVVRVNDRGPFSSGRIIDLSKEAATELGMMRDGTARVRVEYLPSQTREYIAGLGLQVPEFMMAGGDSDRLTQKVRVPKIKATTLPEPEIRVPETKVAAAAVKEAVFSAPENMGGFQVGESAYVQPASIVGMQPSTPTLTATNAVANTGGEQFKIQTAAFSNRLNAEKHAEELMSIGQANITPFQNPTGATYYRVMLGPVHAYPQAMNLLRRTQDLGYKDARIMVE
jgi:rare lipoprotein A